MTQMGFVFSAKASNAKTGPMPVTTSPKATCPPSCPLKDAGCYAKYGRMGMMWAKMSTVKAGEAFQNGVTKVKTLGWDDLLSAIRALPVGTLWRHNQAGDLPGTNGRLDVEGCMALANANRGRRGYTYTHYSMDGEEGWTNRKVVGLMNASGFAVNLSANTLEEADKLADLAIAPVVTVLPSTMTGNVKITTPAGRKVAVCPATYRDDVTCKSCGLCQRQDRKVIVGFPAHGAGKRRADSVFFGVATTPKS